MKKKYTTSKTIPYNLFIYVFCLLCFNISAGQDTTVVESSFNEYVNLPREVAFAHLNKSLYLKGETIGFSVYVLDKNTKKPSTKTTNVYTLVTDENNKIIKKQLIWAKDGNAYGSFSIDSTFTNGNYTFKAYTNWMKNFDEQNLYSQSIKIVDPEITIGTAKITISSKLDAQFLPEGGHLIADAENSVGVVIKDTLGYGTPNITGRVLNDNNMIVSNFKTNHLGIGKFLLLHDSKASYRVEIDFRNRIQIFDLVAADEKGINIALNQVASRVALTFNTNDKTLSTIKNKPYTLFIHNGSQSKTIKVKFENKTTLTNAIDRKDLFVGINIFTLFNENNTPVLERIFFNYDGIEALKTAEAFTKKNEDSLSIQVPVSGIKIAEIAHLSISVLPYDTKSYNADHNILSYTLLQPYIKGYIENAKYYFSDINMKKQYELDNLLLTQGWSSYEWNSVFNNPPKRIFEFETGIAFTANTNKANENGRYILHTSKNHTAQAYIVSKNESTFSHKGFIVEDDEQIEFTEVVGKTKMQKPNLYLQFTPSRVPRIDNFITVLTLKEGSIFEANGSDVLFDTEWDNIEKLDEVVIKANIEKQRIDKLTKYHSGGRIDLFDDDQRANEIDLATYLSGKGFQVFQDLLSSSFSIRRGRNSPAIFLNRRRVRDLSELVLFNMSDIDYIAIDRTTKGYDASVIGEGGSIHIKTDLNLRFKNDKRKEFNQKISLPLTFTSPKTYYVPKYVYYNSDFFREYGVIDWIPNMVLSESNAINLKILNTKTKQIKLFIEGMTNEGRFISEEKVITVN
ncbi:MAG: hypothetical protein ACI9SD_000584 [Pseudohongiellaceae bacterium]|jgi:hypothetical protein